MLGTGNEFVNGLQLYKGKWFSDLVDENMLANALLKRPHEMGTLVSYVFGTQDDGYSSTIDFITGGLGNVMTIENDWYDWDFLIEADRAVTISKAMFENTEITVDNFNTVMPGLGNGAIKLWLEDKWFGPGAIIEFDDKRFQARIFGEPFQDGQDWVYTAYPSGEAASTYIPGELLIPGKQVSRVGSAYEEYSDEADIINYSTPFKLRNTLTTMRLNYSITGSAYSTYLAIAIEDPKTRQKTYYWATYQDWKAMRDWIKRVDYQLVHDQFGSVNGLISHGTNGRPVYRGAGLREQISPANRRYYSFFTLRLLNEFLFDLSYNILGTSERKFMAFTGEMGMLQFDQAVKREVSQLMVVDTKFLLGSGREMTYNGGQFKTYLMPQGIEFIVKHYPPYDDLVHNRTLHPVSGKPIESYRYTICDIGARDGRANIVKVIRKDRGFVQWYTGGSVAPNGYAKNKTTMRSNAKDGYTVHFLGEMGIMLRDPRACGELILDLDLAA